MLGVLIVISMRKGLEVMKNSFKIIAYIMLFIMLMGIFVYCISLRFINPDMTEMRLLITYWKEYCISLIGAAICFLGVKKLLNS